MTQNLDQRPHEARADSEFRPLGPDDVEAVSGAYAGGFDFAGGLAALLRNLPRVIF